jgi:hypothetical protein
MLSSTYFIFPLGVFLIQIVAAFASFSAHVYLDNQYHIAGSPLLRFAWFRRKQQLHFVHHTYGNSNFALIDNFWDRLLGTYRNPDAGDVDLGRSRTPCGDTISCALGASISMGWTTVVRDNGISTRRRREMTVTARDQVPSSAIVPPGPGFAIARSGWQSASSAASR